MAFLSSQTIKRRLEPNIIPFRSARVEHGAYELSLGKEAYITSEENKKTLEPGNILTIHPGQFALLLTEERVTIPDDHIAFISIKASKKFKGLVNVSGFHVDPGFSGHLKFSVYNAGSKNIRLGVGEPLFLIWFAKLDEPVEDPYDGSHNKQDSITSKDIENIEGDIVSPSVLKSEIDRLSGGLDGLEKRVNTIITIGGAILALLLIVIIRSWVVENAPTRIIETPSRVNTELVPTDTVSQAPADSVQTGN